VRASLIQPLKAESAEPIDVMIDKVRPTHVNPPMRLRYEDLGRLADSIRQYGVLQEPLLRPGGEFLEPVVGRRRVEAARRAGIKVLRARVMDLSDIDALLLSIAENEQRQDWTALEKANALATLRKLTGWSLRKIGSYVG